MPFPYKQDSRLGAGGDGALLVFLVCLSQYVQGAWASCLKPVCLELRAGAEPWAQNLWITWYSRSTMRLGTKAVPV